MLHRALFVKAENSSSDSENEMVFVDDSDLDIDMEDCTADKDEISVDDFILVEFLGKRVRKYFAGEVKEDTSEGYVVTFLWRKSPSCNFVFLEVVDESLVPKSDIVMKLLVPRVRGDWAYCKSTGLWYKFEQIFGWINKTWVKFRIWSKI